MRDIFRKFAGLSNTLAGAFTQSTPGADFTAKFAEFCKPTDAWGVREELNEEEAMKVAPEYVQSLIEGDYDHRWQRAEMETWPVGDRVVSRDKWMTDEEELGHMHPDRRFVVGTIYGIDDKGVHVSFGDGHCWVVKDGQKIPPDRSMLKYDLIE